METWTPVKVTIRMGDPEIDEVGVFQGLTRGDDWNGWVTPFFTKDEGNRIVAWTEAMAAKYPPDSVETVQWNEPLNAFVVESPEEAHQPDEPIPDEDIVAPLTLEEAADPLYGIGAYRWTWEEVREER